VINIDHKKHLVGEIEYCHQYFIEHGGRVDYHVIEYAAQLVDDLL